MSPGRPQPEPNRKKTKNKKPKSWIEFQSNSRFGIRDLGFVKSPVVPLSILHSPFSVSFLRLLSSIFYFPSYVLRPPFPVSRFPFPVFRFPYHSFTHSLIQSLIHSLNTTDSVSRWSRTATNYKYSHLTSLISHLSSFIFHINYHVPHVRIQ